jgi:riboflavin kinase/FMN adenylyltransferase
VTFDTGFAAIAPAEFVLRLCGAAQNLKGICVGEGWVFGRNRCGDVHLLRRLGQEHGFLTTEVASVRVGGEVVSSTIIREALASGDIAKAARFLGRDYSVSGTVLRGRGMGRELGFPTANLPNRGEQYPPDGVYVVSTRFEGISYEGVANIGFRPTIGESSERLLEVHLFDFDRNLYGAEVEVSFAHFLRPEKKFHSVADLRSGIAQDVAMAVEWLRNNALPR